MTRARTLADMISDGVIGTTELANDAITPVKLDETGSYAMAGLTVDTDTLHVDSANNRVGFGTTSPARSVTIFEDDQPVFQITNNTSGTANTRGLIQYIANGTTDAVFDNQGSGSGGMFRFMQAGTERLRMTTSAFITNEGGNDYDFRVESDSNANMLFVNAGTDVVDINSTADAFDTSTKLQVAGRVRFGSGFGAETSGMTTPTNSMILTKESFSPTSGATRIYGLSAQNSGYSPSGDTAPMAVLLGGWSAGSSRAGGIEYEPATKNLYIMAGTTGASQQAFSDTGRVASFNSSSIVFNDQGNDQDFRVESDNNANMLFVDAGIDRVGVGTNAPVSSLDVMGSQTATALTLRSGDTNGAGGGGVQVRLAYDQSYNYAHSIRTRHDGSGNYNNAITFYTWNTSDGASDIGSARALDLCSEGAIFNENSRSVNDLRVETDNNTHGLFVNAGEDIVGIGTSSGPYYQKGNAFNARAHIANSAIIGSGYMTIMSNPNGRVFTLDTAANGGQAFLHLQGSDRFGYRDMYFWAINFSGSWTVYSNTNATSGTAPTFTIANNSSQNPTVTLGFNTGYSGGFVTVHCSTHWSLS